MSPDESSPLRVALALVRGGPLWLVSRRAAGRVFAGLWEFPGGRVGESEAVTTAAAREVLEEAGVRVKPIGDLGVVTTAHGGRTVHLHLILCEPAGDSATPCDPAVLEVRWCTLADIRQLPMPPANAEILDRLIAHCAER